MTTYTVYTRMPNREWYLQRSGCRSFEDACEYAEGELSRCCRGEEFKIVTTHYMVEKIETTPIFYRPVER